MDDKILLEDAERVLNVTDLTEIENKTILLTGASGLIGTHIIYSICGFVNRGHVVSNLFLITLHDLPGHLEWVRDCHWIQVLKGDLTEEPFLKSLPEADYIIHAAGYAQPGKFMSMPVVTLKLNTLATFGLIEKVKPSGKFLFISSSAVYTGCTDSKFTEAHIGDSNTNHPRSSYIEGKKCGESICHAYRQKGVEAKSVRFSITYGPGARQGDVRALYTFIDKALSGNEIVLLDNGSAQKVYCYITDAIELLWNVMLRGKDEIYNVGGHSHTSIYNLASLVGKIGNVTVVQGENTAGIQGTILQECLDMTKVEKEFGKQNYVTLEEGLVRTMDWSKQNKDD